MVNVNLLYDAKTFNWYRSSVWTRPVPKGRLWVKLMAKTLGYLALVLWLLSLVVVVAPAAPVVVYRLNPDLVTRMEKVLGTTVEAEPSEFGNEMYMAPRELPPVDPTLPVENRLVIPEIGFDAQIGEGSDWEEVLKHGPWRTPDFGTPEDSTRPMILASHRFGYVYWTREYRRERSFYNLPKLEVGDRVEIIWNQRKYVYEIYEGYTDTKIRDYEADLILYTCEMLNTDKRVIRLARLVEEQ